MRSFRNALLAAAAAGAALLAPPVSAQTPAPASPGASAQTADPSNTKPITLPIPVGHEAKGIKIPYFNPAGVLQMEFFMEQARRVDERIVRLNDVSITIYEDNGEKNLRISLPVSVFDLQTQQITSTKPVTIDRKDFVLRGQSLVFDTKTRKGTLTGKVQMLIYDRGKL